MMDINMDLLQWFLIFFDKKTSGGAITKEIMKNEELAKNYANQLLENLSKEKYIIHL